MDKGSKIYVAGHSGLVGSAIVRHLQAQGYTNLLTRSSKDLDLTNQAATEAFFAAEQPEYVFLAAAKVGGIMGNATHRADFIYDNLLIQNNVIGSSFKHKVKKLLFLGSSCIYPKNAPQPMTEDCLLTSDLEYTNEPYAIAKIAGIKMIESFNLQYGTNYLAVQPTNLYGDNDNFDLKNGHAFPMILRKFILAEMWQRNDLAAIAKDLGITEGKVSKELGQYGITKDADKVTVTLWGSGKPYREFLHVDDMAGASVFVMNNVNFQDLAKGPEVKNTQINVGSGTDTTISDFAHLVAEKVGYSGDIHFDQTHPDGTMRKLLNVDRLTNLGWKYSIDLPAGVERTLAWYKDNIINAK